MKSVLLFLASVLHRPVLSSSSVVAYGPAAHLLLFPTSIPLHEPAPACASTPGLHPALRIMSMLIKKTPTKSKWANPVFYPCVPWLVKEPGTTSASDSSAAALSQGWPSCWGWLHSSDPTCRMDNASSDCLFSPGALTPRPSS